MPTLNYINVIAPNLASREHDEKTRKRTELTDEESTMKNSRKITALVLCGDIYPINGFLQTIAFPC